MVHNVHPRAGAHSDDHCKHLDARSEEGKYLSASPAVRTAFGSIHITINHTRSVAAITLYAILASRC